MFSSEENQLCKKNQFQIDTKLHFSGAISAEFMNRANLQINS